MIVRGFRAVADVNINVITTEAASSHNLLPDLPTDCGYVVMRKGDKDEPAIKTSHN